MGQNVRDRMVELATECVGLGFGRANRDKYLDLVAPGEPAGLRQSFGRMSSCALVVRSLWARLGLDDPRLRAPYKIGSAIETIYDMAREANAWATAADMTAAGELARWPTGFVPAEGDVLALGPTSNVHVATICKVESQLDGFKLWTIDGGQRDGDGAEVVLRRERVVGSDGVARSRDIGPPAARPVWGFVDLVALCARFLPEGAL